MEIFEAYRNGQIRGLYLWDLQSDVVGVLHDNTVTRQFPPLDQPEPEGAIQPWQRATLMYDNTDAIYKRRMLRSVSVAIPKQGDAVSRQGLIKIRIRDPQRPKICIRTLADLFRYWDWIKAVLDAAIREAYEAYTVEAELGQLIYPPERQEKVHI